MELTRGKSSSVLSFTHYTTGENWATQLAFYSRAAVDPDARGAPRTFGGVLLKSRLLLIDPP